MADIPYPTAPTATATPGDKALQDFLDAAADMGDERKRLYALYEHYYCEGGKTRLGDRERTYLEISGLKFAENWCEPIVDTVAERLSVTGFQVDIGDEAGGEATQSELDDAAAISSWLGDLWQRCRMDATQGVIHSTALVKGDSFLFVDWDAGRGRARFTFNRPEICKAHYLAEQPDVMEWVAKVWTTSTVSPTNPQGRAIERLNLYHPDRVEKWYRVQQGGKGGWERHLDEGDPTWPTPWVDNAGAPLGIPVVHFRNKPLGNAYGRSELRGVIPQIDLLTKLVVDMALILDNQSWRQRWATGIDGGASQFKNLPGDVWTSSSPDAKFGDFTADTAEGVLAAIDQTLSRIARRSRTPLHLLTGGDMPSGEALRTAESGLVAKVKDRQVFWGNAWEDAMLIAIRVTETFGDLPVTFDPERAVLSAEWDDPLSRNELEEAQTAELYKDLGVSKHTLLTRLGFDPEHEAEQRQMEAEQGQETMALMLDRGAGMGGTAVPGAPQPAPFGGGG